MERRNREKARMLYDFLDASEFYACPVEKADRSRMNIPFLLRDPALNGEFLAQAEARGLSQLKGHRLVGGMRASLYNAMGTDGVAALVEFLDAFQRQHG